MIEVGSLIRNVSVTLLFKAGAIVLGILTIPAYLSYFDDQAALGIWFSILAVFSWMLFFDLGLGNGIKNSVITAIANNKYKEAKEIILKGYFVLFSISFITVAFIILIYYFSSGLSNVSASMFGVDNFGFEIVFLILGIIFFIQFPLRLSISILLSMQKSAIASFIPFVSQILILCYLLFFNDLPTSNKFIYLVGIYGVSVCIPLIGATIYIVFVTSRWPSGRVNYSEFRGMYPMMVSGSKFFWIQLCLLAVNGSNEFLILKYHAPEDVVTYQVYFRVFSVFLVSFSALTIPLWSAVRQAHAIDNCSRIQQIDKVMKKFILIASIGIVSLCAILPAVFDFWLGHGVITSNLRTAALFAIYTFVMIGIMYSSCIANGFDDLRGQLVFLTIAVIIKFSGLYFYDPKVLSWSGIVLLTIISLLPAVWYLIYDSHRMMASLDKSVGPTSPQRNV